MCNLSFPHSGSSLLTIKKRNTSFLRLSVVNPKPTMIREETHCLNDKKKKKKGSVPPRGEKKGKLFRVEEKVNMGKKEEKQATYHFEKKKTSQPKEKKRGQ